MWVMSVVKLIFKLFFLEDDACGAAYVPPSVSKTKGTEQIPANLAIVRAGPLSVPENVMPRKCISMHVAPAMISPADGLAMYDSPIKQPICIRSIKLNTELYIPI